MSEHSDPPAGPSRTLANGVEMPLLGLGVYELPDGVATERAVTWALEAGYRHIDTAQAYGNEASVGRALRASGVPRDQVFVTTKFRPRSRYPVAALERSLERLDLAAVDLYLIHNPQFGATWAWPGMERAFGRGLARAIGVSNFDVSELDAVTAQAEIRPQVNQIRFNPFNLRLKLLAACEANDVVLEAYSPLTRGGDLDHPAIVAIAERHGRTPAQVLLRWALERNIPVIPKSARRQRIVENARVFDFSLDADEMQALDALDRTGGTDRAVERRWWSPGWRIAARLRRIAGRARG